MKGRRMQGIFLHGLELASGSSTTLLPRGERGAAAGGGGGRGGEERRGEREDSTGLPCVKKSILKQS
jgi:hypothetical protein